MFLCEKCHEKSKCEFIHFSTSYGPCEACHTVGETCDCKPKEGET